MIIAIIPLILVIIGASWYLFPKRFYWIDNTLLSLRPVQKQPANPSIDTLDALDTFITEELTRYSVPGAAVAIVTDNQIVWQKGYGYADLQTSTPVTTDTAFHIASVSKAFLGVAVMKAVKDGYLNLDDEINGILPFAVKHPQFPDIPITLKHLVTHTSGIKDSLAAIRTYGIGDPKISLEAFLKGYLVPQGKNYSAKGNFFTDEPGKTYNYSNVGAALAGYVVEVATQTPFHKYMQEQVFKPLGLNHSGYFQADFEGKTISTAYLRRNTPYGYVCYPTYPDGMIRSSVNDVAVLLAAIMNEGRYEDKTVLSADSTRTLLSPVLPHVPNQGVFWEVQKGKTASKFGHDGNDPGSLAFMYFDAETRLGTVILLNTDTHQALCAGTHILVQMLNGTGIHALLSSLVNA